MVLLWLHTMIAYEWRGTHKVFIDIQPGIISCREMRCGNVPRGDSEFSLPLCDFTAPGAPGWNPRP
jgi:hypothetical protein